MGSCSSRKSKRVAFPTGGTMEEKARKRSDRYTAEREVNDW
jgi:hypothetical protein